MISILLTLSSRYNNIGRLRSWYTLHIRVFNVIYYKYNRVLINYNKNYIIIIIIIFFVNYKR